MALKPKGFSNVIKMETCLVYIVISVFFCDMKKALQITKCKVIMLYFLIMENLFKRTGLSFVKIRWLSIRIIKIQMLKKNISVNKM